MAFIVVTPELLEEIIETPMVVMLLTEEAIVDLAAAAQVGLDAEGEIRSLREQVERWQSRVKLLESRLDVVRRVANGGS